jgi:hypothetical protein
MSFFNKIIDAEIEEKFFKKMVFIGTAIIILVLIIVFANFAWIRNYKVPKDMETQNDDRVEYKIESISTGRKYIEITGWAYKKGQNIGYFNNRFVIRNEETGKYKVLNTEMQNKDEFFSIDEKYDCRRAGMYAKGSSFGVKKGLYQIFIEYKNDGENILFDTGILFNFGE